MKKLRNILPASVMIAIALANCALGPVSLASTTDLTAQRTELESQLKEIEATIAQQQADIKALGKQGATLSMKLKQLQSQHDALAVQIKTTTVNLQEANQHVTEARKLIATNTAKQDKLRDGIANAIRFIHERDSMPDWFVLVTEADTFSSYIEDEERVAQVQTDIVLALSKAKDIAADLHEEEKTLLSETDAAQNLLAVQALQKGKLDETTTQQNTLLKENKNQQADDKAVLSDAQKQADAIKNRIYHLFDTGTQITFGQAVEIAKWVSAQTGVRAAFLLAILTQESSLGQNVGTCNRVGDPATKSWRVIMKPDRDQTPFMSITKALGLDTDTTAVSCPMRDKNGKQIGWGGAMGPAQFIPSTWVAWQPRVAAVTGSAANPWDIRDAFVASALKLKSDGAVDGGNGEWNAAMRYFSGSTDTRFRFYGDQVLATATKYESDIADLGKK